MKKIIFLILSLLIIYIYFDFLNKDYFSIKNININKGLDLDLELTKEYYIDLIQGLKGKNIWFLDTELIENKIEEDIRIRKARINKLFPKSLDVIIEEEEAFAKIKYNNELFFINNNDKIFAMHREVKRDRDIILNLNEFEDLEVLKKTLKKLKLSKGNILLSDIYLDSEENIILMLRDGTRIISNSSVEKERYEIAFALYKKLMSKDRNIKHIDISFVDFIVKYDNLKGEAFDGE